MRRVLRASGKAVWTWPPVGATDAGAMQIQLKDGVSLRRAETVLSGATHVSDVQGSGSISGGIPIPNPDTLEEFKVQTGLYDAAAS